MYYKNAHKSKNCYFLSASLLIKWGTFLVHPPKSYRNCIHLKHFPVEPRNARPIQRFSYIWNSSASFPFLGCSPIASLRFCSVGIGVRSPAISSRFTLSCSPTFVVVFCSGLKIIAPFFMYTIPSCACLSHNLFDVLSVFPVFNLYTYKKNRHNLLSLLSEEQHFSRLHPYL